MKRLGSTQDVRVYDSQQGDWVSNKEQEQVTWVPNEEWFQQCIDNVTLSYDLMKPFPGSNSTFRGYRLGDCIKFCQACDPHYGNQTFVARYSDRACPRDHPEYRWYGNVPIVLDMLHELDGVEGFKKPDTNALIIHLRLGDVIERSDTTNVTTMLTVGGDPHHGRHYRGAIKSYFEYMDNIQESGSKKVVIVGGSHKPQMYQKSRQYLHCLERALVKSGLEVELRTNTLNPDHDFYYVSHAQQLVVSTGGFSNIIGNVAEAQGGKVFGSRFMEPEPKEYKNNKSP